MLISAYTYCISLTWKKINASFQPSFGAFASLFEKEWHCWGLLKAGALRCWEGTGRSQWWCRTCSFPLFFPSFSKSSWNLFLSPFFRIQNILMPGSSRIRFSSNQPLHSSMAAVQPLWGREGLGWRRAWWGQNAPAELVNPAVHLWISVNNPHLCRYKWSHSHVSKAWRLLNCEIWCPRLRDALITALY